MVQSAVAELARLSWTGKRAKGAGFRWCWESDLGVFHRGDFDLVEMLAIANTLERGYTRSSRSVH